jgi:hypothetical protein
MSSPFAKPPEGRLGIIRELLRAFITGLSPVMRETQLSH